MENKEFQALKDSFAKEGTDGKIDIYVNTEGLTQAQYKELLRLFPLEELYRLEAALT